MTHYWGDDWPHWDELYKAISFIETYWRKWGRISVYMCKEKYGTFRDYSMFCTDIRDFINPCKMYKHSKFWIMTTLPLEHLIFKWQAYIYNRGIQLACIKFPNVTDEILSDLQHYGLIKNGPGTTAGGEELHGRYWRKIC